MMTLKTGTDSLRRQWEEYKRSHSTLRTREIADRLNVSEAELVASACDGEETVRLNGEWEEIFKSLEDLGPVMALTRNEAAVHEKTGVYRNVSFEGHAGLVLDEQIDLRVFHKRWGSGFALPVDNPRGTLHSFQFFDKQGDAVHKIYVKDSSVLDRYREIVQTFRSEDQLPGLDVQREKSKKADKSREEVDQASFLRSWSELKDTHDFFPMLRKYKVGRLDALELAEGRFSQEVGNGTVQGVLEKAAGDEISIMVFVGNQGMIQIHSGPVHKIRVKGDWLNVLDPTFNLHLRQDRIHRSWIVEKPTEDGIVTSLELFDDNGDQIATVFGARKPGIPEDPSWAQLINEFKTTEAV